MFKLFILSFAVGFGLSALWVGCTHTGRVFLSKLRYRFTNKKNKREFVLDPDVPTMREITIDPHLCVVDTHVGIWRIYKEDYENGRIMRITAPTGFPDFMVGKLLNFHEVNIDKYLPRILQDDIYNAHWIYHPINDSENLPIKMFSITIENTPCDLKAFNDNLINHTLENLGTLQKASDQIKPTQ